MTKQQAETYAATNGWLAESEQSVDDFITESFSGVLTAKIAQSAIDQINKDTEMEVMQKYKDADVAKEQVLDDVKQNIEVDKNITE